MNGGRISLAFAHAASEAYEQAEENRGLIAGVVGDLRSRVDMDGPAFDDLSRRLFQVLDTNRTAPAVVRIMAFAEELRVARWESARARGWRARRAWHRQADRAVSDLTHEVAATLDGLLAEPY